MLDLNEKLSRKVDSLSNEKQQTHYYDKFDLDSDKKAQQETICPQLLEGCPQANLLKKSAK